VSTTDEARKQVEEARQRLVGTVGEIGTAIDETKAEVQQKARKAAPIAAAAAGAFVLLKVLRAALRRRH
jgi:ElaB/YqjD/DUF883 family membrane-anchored ribosome-binding protein